VAGLGHRPEHRHRAIALKLPRLTRAKEANAQKDESSPAGKVYESLAGKVLEAEQDRRRRVESRGSTVLTTSTTMLTLIFGLTVIVTGKEYTFKSHYAVWSLTLALGAFVVSAVLAIFVQTYGFSYVVISTQTLDSLVKNANWNRTEDDARRMWVSRQAETIKTLRKSNDRKSDLIKWSLGSEVLAIVLLTLASGFELHTRL
jgi:hypothetical protein